MPASTLEILMRNVRRNLKEHRNLRYQRFTTTSAGAAAGTTAISTELDDLDDTWNGCVATILNGNEEGQSRIVEDFTASTDTLAFTNNPFKVQVGSGVIMELTEGGIWSGQDLKQALVDAINELAGALPKAVLRNYIVKETVGSVNGIAAPPQNAIDLHHVEINSKPAIPVPPREMNRMISGQDAFLNPTTSNRYLYLWEGKDNDQGQLRHAPAVNASVVYHKVPLMTEFDENGATLWPKELHQAAEILATANLWLINEDAQLYELWRNRLKQHFESRGVKVAMFSYQER